MALEARVVLQMCYVNSSADFKRGCIDTDNVQRGGRQKEFVAPQQENLTKIWKFFYTIKKFQEKTDILNRQAIFRMSTALEQM